MTMAQVETIIEDSRWEDAALQARAAKACGVVFEILGLDSQFEVSVLGCDDTRISGLNDTFRQKAAATNVLSWPSTDLAPDVSGGIPSAPNLADPELGDIAISYDTCKREAADQAKEFDDHVTHLLVHGTLHLLGYDHETDKDAALMEGLETRILAKLGISDPYL